MKKVVPESQACAWMMKMNTPYIKMSLSTLITYEQISNLIATEEELHVFWRQLL